MSPRCLQMRPVSADEITVDQSPVNLLTLDDPWAVDADLESRAHETHTLIRLADGRYALALDVVAEVLPLPDLTRLPGAPVWLGGIANWRGKVLPVLDLRPLLGAERRPAPTSARLVVLREDGVEAGLLVEGVLGLMTRSDELQEVPATVAPAAASILSGIVDHEGPVALLDVTSVLALRGQLAQVRAAR